jgi:hypothetical protein
MKPIVSVGLSAFIAISGVCAAFAGSSYDGHWTVQLVTIRGDCEPTASWEVGVAASRIAESGAFQATGVVDPQGRVRLEVVSGQDRVSARGKLSGSYGSGEWTSSTRVCSGHWRASRS